jgi:hypothetical protein
MGKKRISRLNESGWLSCSDPTSMLNVLTGKVSERKLRLFACACCRHIWNLFPDDDCRAAIEIAEKYADGKATKKGAEKAAGAIDAASSSGEAAVYSAVALDGRPAQGASTAARGAVVAARTHTDWGDDFRAPASEFQVQADFLRDIFGPNPLHPISLDPAWRTSTLLAPAQAIYEERSLPAGTLDVARLAVLADALEDAGCTDADILNHCRSAGPHVRGCWVVDALLGKK